MSEITLATINQTLKGQESGLRDISVNTSETSKGLTGLLSYFKDQQLKSIEKQREQQQKSSQQDTASGTRRSSGGKGEKDATGGFLSGISNAFKTGGFIGLGTVLAKGLVKRLPGLALMTFADSIVDYFKLGEGNKELRDQIVGGLQGAGFGALFGLRFIPLFGVIGALMKNEEFKTQFDLFTDNLKQLTEKIFGKISLQSVFKTFAEIATKGLKGINSLITGDFSGFFDNLGSSVALIGGLATLLMPGKFLKLLFRIGAFALKGPGKAILALASAGGMAALTKAFDFFKGGSPDTTKTTKTPQAKPGTVVRSAAGNLMIAGADGKATTQKAPKGAKVGDLVKKPTGGTAASQMSKAVTKFPILSKVIKIASKIPGLATAAALVQLATMNPVTVEGVASILGGLGGGALGALAGGAFGAFLPTAPVTAPLFSFVGGMGGYFFGEAIAKGLAEFALGKKVTAFPDFINDIINGGGKDTGGRAGSDQMRMGRGGPTATFTKPTVSKAQPTSGSKIQANVGDPMAQKMGTTSTAGGDGNVIVMDNSNRSNNVANHQGFVMPSTGASDGNNPLNKKLAISGIL